MIRKWVKNLCTYIDNLDTSFSDYNKNPIINGSPVGIITSTLFKEYKLYKIGEEGCDISLEESEYILLKDSIDNFKARVNEARIIEFLKPFTE